MAQTAAKVDERTCLVRAMYFESNRSSRDGLMAVGTVVMNRVASPRYPNTICGVVGQPGQFAYGVLTNPLNPRELPPVERAADAILAGERYKPIGDAMWFHVASLRIPYRVEYMAVAGGNAFYRRTGHRYADIRVGPANPNSVAAPVPASANQAALAEAPQGSVIDRFFGQAHAAPSSAQNCEAARAGLGAISLACEDEASGR
jgi:spore germination cell wall hydrolase CwlJ-like protein